MSNDLERRKYKRKEEPHMVRFRTIPLVAKKMVSPDWDVGAVKDLSAGGMLFYYDKNLELDSLLNLKIDLPASALPINCVGKIIRIEQPQPNSMFRIAAEFTEIDEQEKAMINTTVEKALE
jgi:hypothetical protein